MREFIYMNYLSFQPLQFRFFLIFYEHTDIRLKCIKNSNIFIVSFILSTKILSALKNRECKNFALKYIKGEEKEKNSLSAEQMKFKKYSSKNIKNY